MRLKCFDKGDGDHDFDVTYDSDFRCYWEFERSAVTKFWCDVWWKDGSTTAGYSYDIPVFGGNTVSKSQEWHISKDKIYRYSVDGDTNYSPKSVNWVPYYYDNLHPAT